MRSGTAVRLTGRKGNTVARSGDARKRTWRFKLNEGAIRGIGAQWADREADTEARAALARPRNIRRGTHGRCSRVSGSDRRRGGCIARGRTPWLEHCSNTGCGATVAYDFSAQILNTTPNTGPSDNDVFETTAACTTAPCTVDVSVTRGGDWLATSPDAGQPASFEFSAYVSQQSGTIRITVALGTPCETTKTMTVALQATAENGRTLNPNSRSLSYACPLDS